MIHLHTHSEYSALDGMSSVEELMKTAEKLGMSHLAITDHGNVNGFYELEKQSKNFNVKPIYGCEFYTSYGDADKEDNSYHLIILAKNLNGLKSLYKLHRLSYDNFYKKPQLKLDDLFTYGQDLVVMSACIGGMIPQSIIKEEEPKSPEALIKKFKTKFGEDFYLEIQPTDSPDQMVINRRLFELGKQFDVKIVATNDIHYTFKEDAVVHDVLLAMQFNQKLFVEDKETGKMVNNPKKYSFIDDKFYMRTEDEMISGFMDLDDSFLEEYKKAILNTHEVAKKCEGVELIKGDFRPRYNKIPEGKTAKEHLADVTRKNIKKKYPNLSMKVAREVAHELDVIETEDYSDYFLIVQDLLQQAREDGVLIGDGRGSGAGSKVAYINDITKVDPEEHHLIFERFLDYGRIPDFDSDVSDQDIIFRSLQRQYGEKNVARIITFMTMGVRDCIRKTLSAFCVDQDTINKIAKLSGDAKTLSEAMEGSLEVKQYFTQHNVYRHIIERLEGRISTESHHAGGVVIYPNMEDIAPIKLIKLTKEGKRDAPCICYDKYPVEDIGFVKIDILALKTLTVLDDALKMIEQYEGEKIDIHNIDINDDNIMQMLREGKTHGIFQLSDQASRLMEQQPRNFNDLVVFTSIIRPGTGDYKKYLARRFGKEEYDLEPEREEYMRISEGLIIFQEQYLQLANTYAGWKFGFSDKHIRKNKKLKTDVELEEKFIRDCMKHSNINDKRAKEIWDEIVEVAGGGYGFNKSHGVAYTKNTLYTGYVKCYYPIYFFTSLLNGEISKQDKVVKTITEAKREDIKLLPPQLDVLNDKFLPTKEGIQVPLNYLKGVGDGVIPHLKELAPIKSLEDLWERRTKSIVKKNVITNMIKAGCFDFEADKEEMFYRLKCLQRTKTQIKKEEFPERDTYTEQDFIRMEREALGMNLTAHPLEKYNVRSFWEFEDNSNIHVTGLIKKATKGFQKNGQQMAFLEIELPTGTHKGLIFAHKMKKLFSEGMEDKVFHIKGKKSGDSILIDELKFRGDIVI